ncbi:hypothetical protein E1B28_005451 [Marasmius oreades]|uniref:DUF7729 domain-containing protein n=1 Tax=Marasmius oreades TaxID=181124 RepID=A0A9P7S3V9_9AGAR|nr:uncharacterized protein E1B28_005451 [Marasmius oreades]KAG7094627.1 hypothetical protein E1B28_005451 [Marasmius oreades]
MFTPPPSPLPSPEKERDPMDAAGAALLGAKSEQSEKGDGESERSSQALRTLEWEQSRAVKRRKARFRTITATVLVPFITLVLVFSKMRSLHWSTSSDTNALDDNNDRDSILRPHLDPIYHLNPHVPNSPLNHIPRRGHGLWERDNSDVTTASSVTLTGTALQTGSASKTTSDGASETVSAPQVIPTVPSTPPPLPTPFPQPFDSDLGQNFSTQSCYDFLLNMTNTQPFRSCRPFGMLVAGSEGFADASTSLTTLNSVVWGTCNTNIPYAECIDNVNGFSEGLQSSCAKELAERNTRVMNVLGALQSYPLYHHLGCLTDPVSNIYCYVSAVHNNNPSDVYLYGAGLGSQFPSAGKATPSCSACSRQILAIYAGAAANGTGIDKALLGETALTELQSAFPAAAKIWADTCGSSFAQATVAASNTGVGNRALISQFSVSAFVGLAVIWIVGA